MIPNWRNVFSWKQLSISRQLTWLFIVVFCIPIIVIVVFFYFSMDTSKTRKMQEFLVLGTFQTNRVQQLLAQHHFETQLFLSSEFSDTELYKELVDLKSIVESLSQSSEFNIVFFENEKIHWLFPAKFVTKNPNGLNTYRSSLDFFSDQKSGLIIQTTLSDYRNVKTQHILGKVPSYSVGIILKKDYAEFLSPFLDLFSILLASSGLGFLLILFLFYFSQQTILFPLESITKIAKRIQQGKYEDIEQVTSFTEEITTLSGAFQKMSSQLIDSKLNLEEKVKEQTSRLRRALSQVRASRVKDQALLSSIGEGMIAVDPDGKIMLANQSAETLLGMNLKNMKGKYIQDVCKFKNTDGEFLNTHDQPVFVAMKEKSHGFSGDLIAFPKHHDAFPVEIHASPVLVDQKIIGAILIFQDITKQKEIDRMKTEYISIASHQLRGPLASLKWYGELLASEQKQLNTNQKMYVERVNISTKRMIQLVDDFLTMSRIEQGRVKNDPKRVDLSLLLKNIIENIQVEIEKKQLRFHYHFQSPRKFVTLDPEMLREVIVNLISNAIKYTNNKGEVWVRIYALKVNLMLEVKNTGSGIPKEEQEKIFGKFFRATNVVKQGFEGTGLGLYTAKQLIENMGGTIGFSSVENKETTFWIEIPKK